MYGDVEPAANDHGAPPYLSVIVATRNDDDDGRYGFDPVKRLQAFVNCFEEQCRRTELNAELIVVEWNPPPARPRVGSLLRLVEPSFCTYRFIEVPGAIHQRLRFADVLPHSPMIARNVGIRRARGRFVLATNIDVIFSMELVDFIASGQLQRGYLYRADRHDIQADFPADAPLEVQMNYCASHQLRVHTRTGSFPVDPTGSAVSGSEDIVQSGTVQLGEGWHVLESAGGTGVYRWASKRAALIVNPAAAAVTGHARLSLELESNPHDDRSWVEIVAIEDERPLFRTRVSGRRQVDLPLWKHGSTRERRIELHVTGENPDSRRHLPPHERRESLHYRVSAIRLRPATSRAMFEYPSPGWTNAFETSSLTLNRTGEGLLVATDPRKWSYAIKYGPLLAPNDGIYRFELAYTLLEGGVTVGVQDGRQNVWLPSYVKLHQDSEWHRFEIVVDLCANQRFWIVVSNDHPDGDRSSTFMVQRLEGSVDPAEAVVPPATAYDKIARRLAQRGARFPSADWRGRISALADRTAAAIASRMSARGRARIVRASPEFNALTRDLRAYEERLRELAPLRYLADFSTFLRDHRPDNLHTNGCGDFQLMAREHWNELEGYPELDTLSMHVDAVFSYVADAAGIKEHTLGTAIYHLEDDVGKGPAEDRARLRREAAERGIACLDASTVNIWAAYMRWLGRPMLFNSTTWGFAGDVLHEQVVTTLSGRTESNRVRRHPVFDLFRGFDGWAEPGFERWFYGINVRDWLFTGTSKGLTDRRAVHIEHPPIDEEYFEWIALLTAIANATERFCFAEIGAGWGRWIASAAALCRQKALDFSLIAVEPEQSHFEWMKMVLRDNDINPEEHELFLAAAGADSGELLLAGRDEPGSDYGHRAVDPHELANWSVIPDFVFRPVEAVSLAQVFAKHERIDLVDMDVQGTEDHIVAGGIDVLNRKVRMIHVGTHSKEAEARLADVLWKHGWLSAFSYPNGRRVETAFGRVAFGDGAQTWVNPRWPDLHRALVGGALRSSSVRAAGAHAQS